MVDSSEIIIYLSVSFIPLGRVLYCCKEYWAGVRSGGRGACSMQLCSRQWNWNVCPVYLRIISGSEILYILSLDCAYQHLNLVLVFLILKQMLAFGVDHLEVLGD
jgi:hypothetical protein